MQNEIAADKQLRKRITLTGDPKFFDLAQATNPRRKERDHRLAQAQAGARNPGGGDDGAGTGAGNRGSSSQTDAQAQPAGGKFDIEVLRALGDVHLVAPGEP